MGFFTSKKAKLAKEAQGFYDVIIKRKSLESITSRLTLESDERAYLEERTVLKEKRSVKGHAVLQSIDEGTLTLTNERLIFNGKTENRFIDLGKIVSASTNSDSLEITINNREKSLFFFVKNSLIWNTVYLLLKTFPDSNNLPIDKINIEFK